MAINYPTSLDSFTNPTSTDPTDSPSHSLQHANANDALEALEAKVGIGNSTAGSATAGYVLTVGTGGTTTWEPSGELIPISTGGTAAYTFASTDQGKILEFNGTFTVTVPPEATYNFPTGSVLNLLNIGTGTLTIAGGTAVTVNGNPGLKLSSQWAGASIVKRGANTWVAVGDLSA
jgi:hypothetical protein